ncbi:MAG: hypothetical protein JRH17_06035 [Deltaproteobacteria bacterium]|nr:hypothetical protein [Deltaproteobacteria bacterium]
MKYGFAISTAIVLLFAGTTQATAGEAMDLARLESRWVALQVVTTIPGDPEPHLSGPALGWYEAGPGKTQRSVTVPGPEVERIFFADRSPVDHSFSDFVWVFDVVTGHVVSASFSGLVDEPIRIGPIRSSVRVSILVELSTRAAGGYRAPRELAGRTVIDYCPDPTRLGCTEVPGAVYDSESGWVSANGGVCAVWRSLSTHAYTSIGQARFQELDPSRVAMSTPSEPTIERRPAGSLGDARRC